MKNQLSAKEQIKRYLQEGHTLTSLQALDLFKTMRLGAVIHRLKREGMDISSRLIETSTGKHVSEYRWNRPVRTVQGEMFQQDTATK